MNEYREMVGLDVFASGGNEIVSAAKALKKEEIVGLFGRSRWIYSRVTGAIFRATFFRCCRTGYIC